MKLEELIEIVDNGYPDGKVAEAFIQYAADPDQPIEVGDTLAVFVMREICENFDAESPDDSQIQQAMNHINNAIAELTGVVNILNNWRTK